MFLFRRSAQEVSEKICDRIACFSKKIRELFKSWQK